MNEFEAFQAAPDVAPPRALSEAIQARVGRELNPRSVQVFLKLAGVHGVTTLATLAACPQFGIRSFGEGMGLMHYFMALGTYPCMVACGSFFLGSSLLVAALVLRPEEVRQLRQNRLLQMATLALLSMGAFLMLDARIGLGIAASWVLGAIAGGLASLEAAWHARRRVLLAAR
jgi:hypothetical protein